MKIINNSCVVPAVSWPAFAVVDVDEARSLIGVELLCDAERRAPFFDDVALLASDQGFAVSVQPEDGVAYVRIKRAQVWATASTTAVVWGDERGRIALLDIDVEGASMVAV